MEEPELMTLVSQTSLLMETFDRRCGAIEQRLAKTRQSLDGLAEQVPGLIQRSADDLLRSLPQQVLSRMREGFEHSASDYQRKLSAAAKMGEEASVRLAVQMERSQALHRALLWKVAGITGGSVVVLLTGAIWLASHYAAVIERNQISADLLRAYNAADVVLCADGKLCANVTMRGQKQGARGAYLPINPR